MPFLSTSYWSDMMFRPCVAGTSCSPTSQPCCGVWLPALLQLCRVTAGRLALYDGCRSVLRHENKFPSDRTNRRL